MLCYDIGEIRWVDMGGAFISLGVYELIYMVGKQIRGEIVICFIIVCASRQAEAR